MSFSSPRFSVAPPPLFVTSVNTRCNCFIIGPRILHVIKRRQPSSQQLLIVFVELITVIVRLRELIASRSQHIVKQRAAPHLIYFGSGECSAFESILCGGKSSATLAKEVPTDHAARNQPACEEAR